MHVGLCTTSIVEERFEIFCAYVLVVGKRTGSSVFGSATVSSIRPSAEYSNMPLRMEGLKRESRTGKGEPNLGEGAELVV